ncbi:MAG TPA: hypothetical protein VEW28_02035 [Candidatus Kapabacteria bacterium]|nr:hypothetical protein [Candidatus Kapabacteria bacterium]
MGKRLLFGALFFIGTLAAAIGWLFSSKLVMLAVAGHTMQVIGVLGTMLMPDHSKEEDINDIENHE